MNTNSQEFSIAGINVNRLFLFIFVGLTGALLVLFHTRYGPGASGDSSFYIMGAENILAGNGFYRFSGGYELRPITGFPPGLSTFLAAFSWLPGDLFDAARYLNALLFGVNILIVGKLVSEMSRSNWAGIIAQLLILFSPTQFDLHSWVMSEPLYIFLSLSILWLLRRYLDRSRTIEVITMGLLLAASILTRYVGASLFAAVLLIVLAFGPVASKRRLMDAAILAIVTVIPVIAWFRRNAAVAGTLTNREINFHPMRADLIRQYLAEISSWFIPNALPAPSSIRAIMAVLLAAGIVAAFGLITIRQRKIHWDGSSWVFKTGGGTAEILQWLILLYISGYAAILIINSTFLDAATTASAPPRYLAPIYAVAVMFFIAAGRQIITAWKSQALRGALIGVLLITGGFKVYQTVALLNSPLAAAGYTGRRISWPATTDYLQKVENDRPILSNNPELVYILSGRPAYVRPIRFDVYQLQARSDYQQQLEATIEKLDRGAIYVIFEPIESMDREVIAQTGAERILELPHAVVYGYPDEVPEHLSQ